MSSDFETYEQDFGTITAEVTNKIGRIPKLSGGKTVVFISWDYADMGLGVAYSSAGIHSWESYVTVAFLSLRFIHYSISLEIHLVFK